MEHLKQQADRALSGTLTVTTFTNTYQSNQIFKVNPQLTSILRRGQHWALP
jgi:hypothetical protein